MRRLAAGSLLAGVLLITATASGRESLRIDQIEIGQHPTVFMLITAPTTLAGVDASAGFLVEENGRPRPTSAQALTSHPLEVMLLVDTSGSMKGAPLRSAVEAASQFTTRMPSTTRIGLIGFGSVVGEMLDFTDDPAIVVAALEALTATGETALYDGLAAASDSFDLQHPARRFIVLLSDGGDTASTAESDTVAALLTSGDIGLYAVALTTSDSDPEALAALTDRVVSVDDAEALAGVYDEIADELVSQYEVTYESVSWGSTEVRVSVTHGDVHSEAVTTVELPSAPPTTVTTTTVIDTAPPPTMDTAVTAPPPVPPVTFFGEGPGIFGNNRAFAVGLAVVFLALVLILVPAVAPDPSRHRLARPTSVVSVGGAVSGLTRRAESLASRILRRRGKETALNHALDSAGIALRPGEFIVLVSSAAVVGFVVGTMLGGPIPGLLFAIAGLLLPFGVIKARTDRRRKAFADQLEGTLQLIAGSLRAGYGLLQAANTVSNEAAAPTSEEFQRVVMEVRLGRDLVDSLDALAGRVANQDFGWIVQAIRIQRDVGGDLAELLDTISSTIRDRQQLRRQVQAQSAEGRLSAVVLLLLPFGLAMVIMITSPDYLTPLVETTIGRILIGAGLVLMVIGTIWIRRIIRPVF